MSNIITMIKKNVFGVKKNKMRYMLVKSGSFRELELVPPSVSNKQLRKMERSGEIKIF